MTFVTQSDAAPVGEFLHVQRLPRTGMAELARVLAAQGVPLRIAAGGEADLQAIDLGRLRLCSLRFPAREVRLDLAADRGSAVLLRAPAQRMVLRTATGEDRVIGGGDVALLSAKEAVRVTLAGGGRLDIAVPGAPGDHGEQWPDTPVAVLPLSLASVKMLIYVAGYLQRAAPHRRSDAQVLQRQFGETLRMAMDHLSRDWSFPTEFERLGFSLEAALGDIGLTLSGFARHAGMSPRKVQAVFAAGGTTFSDLLRDRRLERARRLLSEPGRGRKVAQVGFDCGFKDASYFAKCFRARYGESPTAFRRAAGQPSAR